MKHPPLSILIALIVVCASCHLRRNPEEGFIKDGEYTEPLVEWKIKIPAGYKMSNLDDFKKDAMSESYGQLQKENGAIPFSRIKDKTNFTKDHYNFLSVTLFDFDSSEDDWREANRKTKVRNYLGFESYGATLDSTATKEEVIDGKKTLVYEFKVMPNGSQPALRQRYFSYYIKKYDFNVVSCSDNIVDDQDMVSAVRNCEWTERRE